MSHISMSCALQRDATREAEGTARAAAGDTGGAGWGEAWLPPAQQGAAGSDTGRYRAGGVDPLMTHPALDRERRPGELTVSSNSSLWQAVSHVQAVFEQGGASRSRTSTCGALRV